MIWQTFSVTHPARLLGWLRLAGQPPTAVES